MLVTRSATRRRRTLGALGLLCATALAAAGCATSQNASSDAALPGISGDSVKLGYIVVDLGTLAQNLGFVQADYGGVAGQSAAIKAVVDHVNANGGMGGRRAEFVVRSYDGVNDSPQNTEAMCKGLTQDDKVFAAVFDAGVQNNTHSCYAGQRTLMIDETLVAHDDTQFDTLSPYLWSPTHPEYTSFMRAYLETLRNDGFFTGASGVLVVPVDGEVQRRVTDTVVMPFLKSVGVTNTKTSYIDSTNTGTLGATSAEAIASGIAGKLDRVLVVGGARILPVALADQGAVRYNSKWAVSSFDNPTFLADNPDTIASERLVGMTGLGYKTVDDVPSDAEPQFPDPANPAQQKCVQIISSAGATPPDNLRMNWKNALQFCDATLFLKAVLDAAPTGGPLTGAQFKEAVGRIGTTYASSIAFGSKWGPGTYAGTNLGRSLSFNPACQCFGYSGALVDFSAGAAPAAPGSVAPPSVAPGSVAPQPVAPQPVAPSVAVAPQSVAPQSVAPQSVAPQSVAP